MKKIFFFIFCILCSIIASSQDDNKIRNTIAKNIVAYQIWQIHSEQLNIFFASSNTFKNLDRQDDFLTYLPDSGCGLNFRYYKTNMKFIDSNFDLYEVKKDINEYRCKTKIIQFKRYAQNDSRFLVAIHKRTSQILFLSGNFFISDFYHFYQDSELLEDEKIFQYIKMRLFSVEGIEGMTKIRSTRKKLFLKVIKGRIGGFQKYKLIVPKKKPEDFIVK